MWFLFWQSTKIGKIRCRPDELTVKIDTSRRVNAFTAIRQARTCRISVEPHDVIARKIGAFPRGLTIGRSAPITSSTSLPAAMISVSIQMLFQWKNSLPVLSNDRADDSAVHAHRRPANGMPFYAVLTLNLRRSNRAANECRFFATPVYRRRQQLNSHTPR